MGLFSALKLILAWGVKAAAAALVVVLAWLAWSTLTPDVEGLLFLPPESTAMMEHRKTAWRGVGNPRRIKYKWVPLGRISPLLQQAVLIAEDDKFFRHNGFDWGMIRWAARRNMEEGNIRFGGSSLTQQLAKNLYLSPQKSFWRKLREMVLTWRLENNLPKNRIFELYLNLVEWGRGIFGAQAASRHYFGRNAANLTPLMAARLAAVLPNPRRFNPARPSRYIKRRAAQIEAIMRKRGLGKLWR